MKFRKFFEQYGDELCVGYERAQADGSVDTFSDWVLREYRVYRRDGNHFYEVLYVGVFPSGYDPAREQV